MKKIAIDVEGTLADIYTPYIKKLNELKNKMYTLEDITDWDFNVINSSVEEFLEITKGVWKEYQKILPTEPNLKGKIKKIRELGYEIDIVTARQDSLEEMKKWLQFIGVEYKNFYKTPHLKESKKNIIISNGYLVVVDDNPLLAEEMDENKKTILLLYEQPWNRKIKEKENVKKVKSFNEVISYLRNLR